VSTAVADAGELDVNASPKGIVWRIGNDGVEHQIPVSSRETPDFKLQAGDILEIPDSSGKRTGQRCLSVVAS